MTVRHAKPARQRVWRRPGLEVAPRRSAPRNCERDLSELESYRPIRVRAPASFSSDGAARLGCLSWRGSQAVLTIPKKASAKTAAFFYE